MPLRGRTQPHLIELAEVGGHLKTTIVSPCLRGLFRILGDDVCKIVSTVNAMHGFDSWYMLMRHSKDNLGHFHTLSS